ncbi:uncharacterized protein JCM6883_005449, partial [Sporobolomyces salmoneus]|uniref:uncharacterized protein n=1 Tax=Sporobolomyces salmoneus TaxID=183962 RepID=UPI00317E39D2
MDSRSSIVYPHGGGWKGAASRFVSQHLNFYRIHLLAFTFVPLVASGIFYASNGPSPQNSIAYIDCLFLCYSAMTVCGLTTVLFANITVWQQVILFLLMTSGSISFVSIIVVLVRRHYFMKRFQYLIENNAQVREQLNAIGAREAQLRHQSRAGTGLSSTLRGPGSAIEDDSYRMESIKYKQKKRLDKLRADMIRRVDTPVRVNEMSVSGRIRELDTGLQTHSIESVGAPRMSKLVNYLTFDATVGRNSRFHHLTAEQQEELGGIEFRALSLLLKIIIGYWFGLQLIGVLTIAPWLTASSTYRAIFEATDPPINPTFFSFFQVFSSLSNTGMSLVDASMIPFNSAYWFILLVAFLILAGNTALPCFLRLTIWIGSKLVPRDSRTKETLSFLLDHPRRTYIYLFPAHQTWQLVFVLICLNAIDWIAFVVLDIGNPQIEALSPGLRCIDGFFQSVAVRTAGFSIVGLATIAPALQWLYIIMMYLSAYPIAMSVRSTNTYEDQAVGVQETEEEEEEIEETSRPSSAYLLFHVRRQLAFDIWFLCGAVF